MFSKSHQTITEAKLMGVPPPKKKKIKCLINLYKVLLSKNTLWIIKENKNSTHSIYLSLYLHVSVSLPLPLFLSQKIKTKTKNFEMW